MYRRGNKVAARGPLIGILIILVLGLSAVATAIEPITPAAEDQTLNDQPLFSWTDYAGNLDHYTLTITPSDDPGSPWHEYDTTAAYLQLQTPLPAGNWQWHVTAHAENETETTTTRNLTILERPSFSIEPDLSRYDDNHQVDFHIDAPKGSKVQVNVTKEGFSLPFTTDDLQNPTFSTFLEPGTYNIRASFDFEGLHADHADVLVLKETTPSQHLVAFNITDSEDEPVRGARITITGDAEEEATTDRDGEASVELETGHYEFIITADGFLDDSFEKKIDEDRTFRERLVPEDLGTAATTPTLAATATIMPDPEVTITSPLYGETIKETPLQVTFTLSSHASVQGCELLAKSDGQQGWRVVDQVKDPSEENEATYDEPPQGKSLMKVQCSLEGLEKTVTSQTRTLEVSLPPKHNPQAEEFLEELQDATRKAPQGDDPLLLSLDVKGKIAAAKKRMTELDTQYVEAATQGATIKEKEIADTIDKEIESYKGDLITSYEVTDREEGVTAIDMDAAKSDIKEWVSQTEISDKQKQAIREKMLQEQSSYTIRSKTTVAKLVTMGGDERYVTGLTRDLQPYYTEDTPERILLTEDLPSYFLQQTGTPEVLGADGKELAKVEDGRIRMEMTPEGSYTLLFKGNVKPAMSSLNSIVIRQHENVTDYLDKGTGGFNGITGAVTNVLQGVGSFSPLVWVFLAVIIAAVIIKPFGVISTSGNGKDVQRLTETIHNTLDLMEQGLHEQAFNNYPSIIDSYEKLKPRKQEALSFAITSLSSALHAYTVNQSVSQTLSRLQGLSSRSELAQVQAMTMQLIEDYKGLDSHSREQVKPSLLQLQQQLRETHALLSSSKPTRKHPLP